MSVAYADFKNWAISPVFEEKMLSKNKKKLLLNLISESIFL